MICRLIALAALMLLGLRAHAAEVTVTGALFQRHVTAPGDFIQGSVALQNNSDSPQSVIVYQADYRFAADGSNAFEPVGANARSNGAWIALSTQQLVLQPAESREVHYTIDVPDDDTLDGTYWSMIMIEGGSFTEPEAEEDDGAVAVETRFRYGVQVVSALPGAAEAQLAILDRRLVADDTQRALQIDMENQGARLSRPLVWAEVFDADGTSSGRLESVQRRLYPGCSARYDFDLSALGVGVYTALVVVDAGDDGVVGSQYTLELR